MPKSLIDPDSLLRRMRALRPRPGGNIVDLERIRIEREVAALRDQIGGREWAEFTDKAWRLMRSKLGTSPRQSSRRSQDQGNGDPW